MYYFIAGAGGFDTYHPGRGRVSDAVEASQFRLWVNGF